MAGERRRKKKYRFFKVLLGDFSTQLRIPPEFEKHVAKEEDAFLLEGARGKTWPVEIERTADHGYAMTGTGWVDFVRDNALQEFEFLVFGYDGHRRFGVQVFDRTACERKLQVKVKPQKRKGKEKAGKEEPPKVKRKRGMPWICSLPVVDGGGHVQQGKDDDEVIILEVKKADRSVPIAAVGKFMQSMKLDVTVKKENLDLVSKTKIMGDGNDNIRLTKKTGGRVKPATVKTKTMGDCHKNGGKLVTSNYHYTKPERCPLTFHEIGSINPEDNSFKSCNPHFIAYMKRGNVCTTFTLVLPLAFARRYLPSKKTQLVLRDPKGTAWVVAYIGNPKRSSISGGWLAFMRANNLKVGDLCVFELVGPIELQVHIVPADACETNSMKRKSLET